MNWRSLIGFCKPKTCGHLLLTRLHPLYVDWFLSSYTGIKFLHLGISTQSWILRYEGASPFPCLNCTPEEADDRNNVPFAGHFKLPVRAYIHQNVIRCDRCLCMPVVCYKPETR